MRSKLALPACLAPALLAALLTACGGGGGGSPAASNEGVMPPTTPTTPVTPTEPGAPAATGDTATDGFNWFNYRRSQIGLSVLARNSRIDAAAAGHSNYLRLNNTVVHTQTQGSPGFTGAQLSDRFAAAGYTLANPYAYGEVISAASDRSGFYHAEELIAAIYHRFVVFEPVFREMGTGAATGSNNYTYFTADLATVNGYGAGVGRGSIANYPANGQTAVPVSFFSDNESPDPVPNQNEVGYPISVHADISAQLRVTTFTVRQRGAAGDLSVRLLARATDAETPVSAAAIIPLARLSAGTVYDVTFTGTVDSVPVSRNWSFTTK